MDAREETWVNRTQGTKDKGGLERLWGDTLVVDRTISVLAGGEGVGIREYPEIRGEQGCRRSGGRLGRRREATYRSKGERGQPLYWNLDWGLGAGGLFKASGAN